MRFGNWKVVFCEQREPGGFKVWSEPFVCLRVPKIFNLRMDPYERHGGQKADDLAMRMGIAWGGQIQDALKPLWQYAGAPSLEAAANSHFDDEPGIRLAASASAESVPMNRLRLAPSNTGTPRL